MSATLDGERIARWLDAPRLSSPRPQLSGIASCILPRAPQETVEHHLARVVLKQALRENPGDVLAFLPGGARSRAQAHCSCCRHCTTTRSKSWPCMASCRWPNSSSRWRRPKRACAASCWRRTWPNPASPCRAFVRSIDAGLAREPRFDPQSGFTRLETVIISQASADQRAGRAGRVAEGTAYRLWPQSRGLEPARTAEIEQAELVRPRARTGGLGQ
jgi:ATP-dependent helicase HrpB